METEGKKKRKMVVLPVPEDSVSEMSTEIPNQKEAERFPSLSGFMRSFKEKETSSAEAKLGTLIGVFFPSIQNVFGVLMFLRMPWCVGVMGTIEAFAMVALCCTYTACTSLSAVVTNGKTGRGGPYYLITRSLGAEVGSGIGVLLCMANTIAVAMYVIGGLEILLISLAPQLIFSGTPGEPTDDIITRTGFFQAMTNIYRLYGVALTLIVLAVVAAGVRFTQLFAPLSLFCVIISILSLYAGGIEKSIRQGGPHICLLGDNLLVKKAVAPNNVTNDSPEFCSYCSKNSTYLSSSFCPNGSCPDEWNHQTLHCELAIPGIPKGPFMDNYYPDYLGKNVTTGNDDFSKRPDLMKLMVFQDLATGFFVCLGIYFPSVTGIKTGANMSGDLKRPQKSIPFGTMAAWGCTTAVYLTYVLMFGAVVHRALLQDKYGLSLGGSMPIAQLAWPHYYVVVIGSFTSTFGAAIQSLCAAPKLLQSIAEDDTMPFLRPFARTVRNEPLWGQLLLFGIALIFVLIARLDFVAPIVQQSFLTTYAGLNLSCAVCSMVGFPSWRPRFRCYNMYLSLFGFFLAVFLMFATQPIAALICIAVGLLVYLYVAFRGNRKEYGDSVGGLQVSLARAALLGHKYKPKTRNLSWRPRILVLNDCTASGDFPQVLKLILAADQLSTAANRKFTVVATLMHNQPHNYQCHNNINAERSKIREAILNQSHKGYAKPIVCDPEISAGRVVSTMLQSCMVGQLRPNTLLLNAPSTSDAHVQMWIDLHCGPINLSTLLLARGHFPCCHRAKRRFGRIDIWWILDDGDVLVLLAQILNKNKLWKQIKFRLYMVVDREWEMQNLEAKVKQCVAKLNMDVETVLLSAQLLAPFAFGRVARRHMRWNHLRNQGLTNHQARGRVQLIADQYYATKEERIEPAVQSLSGAQEINDKIVERSSGSDLVLINIPLSPPDVTEASMRHYLEYLETITNRLPRVLMVRASGNELINQDKL